VSSTFAAIDFETADTRPESACALGVVRVEEGEPVDHFATLLRCPPSSFRFAKLHGIRREDTRGAPEFRRVWPHVSALFAGARFIAAHYAPFDRTVLHVLCLRAGILVPSIPFVCTRDLATRVFSVPSGRLDRVCETLQIPLDHHNPLSDAAAAAEIVLRAIAAGAEVFPQRRGRRNKPKPPQR
jgi:DNA polymerase-3 subunit epsilon